jgi:hypothetical protein
MGVAAAGARSDAIIFTVTGLPAVAPRSRGSGRSWRCAGVVGAAENQVTTTTPLPSLALQTAMAKFAIIAPIFPFAPANRRR